MRCGHMPMTAIAADDATEVDQKLLFHYIGDHRSQTEALPGPITRITVSSITK